MEITASRIEEYCTDHSSDQGELLQLLERRTHLQTLHPRMLSGPLQGRILSFISKLIAPTRILEIGTFTGYSSLCLAEGLTPDGSLITIDNNPEMPPIFSPIFAQSAYRDQIDFRLGSALDIIPTLPGFFDLIFIDADKQNYLNYYELCLPKLHSGGVILADNVLWSGKIFDSENTDEKTQALRDFNDFVAQDNRIEKVLLPIRDGIFALRKK